MSYPPPGPPPGYGPAPYGAPPGYGGYGYGPVPQEHPQGTTIMVLGILGIVLCQLTAPVAWVMGNRVLAEIDADPQRYSNRSNVQVGRICGIVGSILLGVSVAFVVIYLVFIVAVVAGSST